MENTNLFRVIARIGNDWYYYIVQPVNGSNGDYLRGNFLAEEDFEQIHYNGSPFCSGGVLGWDRIVQLIKIRKTQARCEKTGRFLSGVVFKSFNY